MPAPGELRFRTAEQGDAQAIAALHTDSWQRHYRIAYSDAFLDDEAPGFLLDLWTRRLAAPDPRNRTILAELQRAGDPARLNGKPKGLRYTWPDPAKLRSVQP
jgi:hypothetical protein